MCLISYKYNTLTKSELIEILQKWSNFFSPNLTTYVKDVNLYAEKLIKNAVILEAYKKDVLVALMAVYMNTKHAFITHFVVHSDFQKQGIGTKIFQKIIEPLKEKNCVDVTLECYSSSIEFYKKLYFNVVDRKEDKYVMKCSL